MAPANSGRLARMARRGGLFIGRYLPAREAVVPGWHGQSGASGGLAHPGWPITGCCGILQTHATALDMTPANSTPAGNFRRPSAAFPRIARGALSWVQTARTAMAARA